LIDEYLPGSGSGPISSPVGASRENEIILKKDEFYQLSIFEAGTVPGSIKISWYEHTPKNVNYVN
jgi:hypothetical protein